MQYSGLKPKKPKIYIDQIYGTTMVLLLLHHLLVFPLNGCLTSGWEL